MLSPESTTPDNLELPEYIAAIDLGSNSFHMVVARTSHGEIRTLDRLGEKVQLAAGMTVSGELTEEAQLRALDCLRRFSQRIQDLDAVSVQIVATNALRVARNRRAFIRRAEAIIGVPIEIISGREEARLIYLGVSHTLSDDAGKRLVIDIGGGSTEFIIGEHFEPKILESLQMGCISYRDQYFNEGKITASNLKRATTRAALELLAIKQQFSDCGWDSCVGASGSVKTVFTAAQHLGLADDVLTMDCLRKLKDKIIELGHINHLGEVGIKKDRQSIFPSGFAILYACFEELGITSMVLTGGALREGLLYDMIGRIRHEDVRERSISCMQKRYDVDPVRARTVELTVLQAFDQVVLAWELTAADRQLLVWASKVFEVGMAIAHSQYHKHGAYLIRYSELAGFTRLSQLHLSTIVRLHRRKFAQEYFDEMKDSEKVRVQKLCILFRLVSILTAARNSEKINFRLKVLNNQLELDMGDKWLEQHPLTLVNLENEMEYLRKAGFSLVIR